MTLRFSAAASLTVATALLASVGPVLAQSAPTVLPYDARRGVFSFAAGLESSLPAVVKVTTLGQSRGPSSDADDPKPYASGSGVVIDAAQGLVITNNHVVENGRKFTVDLIDGRLFDAVRELCVPVFAYHADSYPVLPFTAYVDYGAFSIFWGRGVRSAEDMAQLLRFLLHEVPRTRGEPLSQA